MTLELQSVGKDVGADTHLDDISLTLENGSLNVLLGADPRRQDLADAADGGARRPDRAAASLVDGQDVTGLPVQRRNVAMVYQQFINYPSLSVFENIASPLRVAGLPRGRDRGARCARRRSS